MKYSILDRLNRRKSSDMFTKPKPVEAPVRQREYQHSVEHRTAIQFELQELRKLVLESETLEATHRSEFRDREVTAF